MVCVKADLSFNLVVFDKVRTVLDDNEASIVDVTQQKNGPAKGPSGARRRGNSGRKPSSADSGAVDFTETVLSVRRVSKVVKGGRRLSFSAFVVVGDRNGRVGMASGKSKEVASAISKASKKAKRSMIQVPLYQTTIPFTVEAKFGAGRVVLRSAGKGTGVIAGGAVRSVMEAVGIKDVLAKSIGSSTSHVVANTTIAALKKLRSAAKIAQLRGISVAGMIGESNATTG
jgi:small subunit ribosomal protein S5